MVLFPSSCAICARPGRSPCAVCAASLVPAPAQDVVPGLHSCHALLSYEGNGRELVAALKYRNNRNGLRILAAAMAELVVADHLAGAFTIVTWAPTSPTRRRRRGYDQAELLARQVARRLGRPCRCALRRLPGQAQTGRSRADRAVGVAFSPVRPSRSHLVSHGGVLLVDDVLTTGATLAAAANALREAGAGPVVGLVLAATPARSHSR